MDHAALLVDRYFKSVAPTAALLARTLELPLIGALPASAEQRLKARNQRMTLFELETRGVMARALSSVANNLRVGVIANESRPSVWRRLMGAAR